MNNRVQRACVFAVAVVAMAVSFLPVSGQMPVRAPRYAITNARIVTAAGPVIDKGTVVMREGIIEDVGAAVAAPADALVVDGTGLVVYPGMIDMSNTVGGRGADHHSGGGTGGAGGGSAGGTGTRRRGRHTRQHHVGRSGARRPRPLPPSRRRRGLAGRARRRRRAAAGRGRHHLGTRGARHRGSSAARARS